MLYIGRYDRIQIRGFLVSLNTVSNGGKQTCHPHCLVRVNKYFLRRLVPVEYR